MTGETRGAGVQEAATDKGPASNTIEAFGKPSDALIKRNFYMMESLRRHLIGSEIVASLVAVPASVEKPKRKLFWGKRPPNSVTFIGLAASPADDSFADDVPESVKNEKNSRHMAIAIEDQIKRGGLKEDLLKYSSHEGERKATKIIRVRRVKHKVSDNLWVPVFILETKTAGESGTDQVVLASFWDTSMAKAEVGSVKADLADQAGEGKQISDRSLEEFVGGRFDTSSKYSLNLLRMLQHLGKNRAAKKTT